MSFVSFPKTGERERERMRKMGGEGRGGEWGEGGNWGLSDLARVNTVGFRMLLPCQIQWVVISDTQGFIRLLPCQTQWVVIFDTQVFIRPLPRLMGGRLCHKRVY